MILLPTYYIDKIKVAHKSLLFSKKFFVAPSVIFANNNVATLFKRTLSLTLFAIMASSNLFSLDTFCEKYSPHALSKG